MTKVKIRNWKRDMLASPLASEISLLRSISSHSILASTTAPAPARNTTSREVTSKVVGLPWVVAFVVWSVTALEA